MNKDGHITYDEFLNANEIFKKIPPKERLECAFDLFDFDNDGLLTREEVKAGIIAMLDIIGVLRSSSFIEELTLECMRELDFNKDGSVTRSKIVYVSYRNRS